MKLLALFSLVATSTPLEAKITLTEADDRLRIEIDGALFTEYRSDKKVPCLYPVISPSGAGLTRNFPFKNDVPDEEHDHPHHVSIWFTHGLVNGVDFWAQHLKRKGRIVHKSFGPRSIESHTDNGIKSDTARFSVELSWQEGDKIHLTETRHYTITARGNTRLIDMTSILTGTNGDTLFGDTKEGSSAIRVAPTLRTRGKCAQGSILTSTGKKNKAAWGTRAAWVAYSGPDASGEPAVIAMFDHPSNLRHPTWWHARDYGLLAANPFGQSAFENKTDPHLGDHILKQGDSLTLQYRILLHHGDLDSARVPEEWEAYSEGSISATESR